MGIWGYGNVLTRVAVIIAMLFVAVLWMHACMPHEHEHELFGTGLVLPVHTATGEKFFTMLMLASIYVTTGVLVASLPYFIIARLRGKPLLRGKIPVMLFLCLFARGILHSKAH